MVVQVDNLFLLIKKFTPFKMESALISLEKLYFLSSSYPLSFSYRSRVASLHDRAAIEAVAVGVEVVDVLPCTTWDLPPFQHPYAC
jgi:hypothetical protein